MSLPRPPAVVALVGILSFAPPAAAGTFTYLTDPFADPDVAPGGAVFTHAIDFGKGAGGGPVVNGLRFNGDGDANGGAGFANWLLTGAGGSAAGMKANNLPDEIAKAVNDFRYGGVNGLSSVTLKGLTPGASYVTTFYSRSWDVVNTRNVTVTASDDAGAVLAFNQDGTAAEGDPSRLTYEFTATSNALTLSFQAANAGDTFHYYAMTNRVTAGSPFARRVVTGNADAGIDGTKQYTHAVDFNGPGGGPARSIDGVTFVPGGIAGDGGFGNAYSLAGAATGFANDPTNVGDATDGLGAMLTDFVYGTTNGANGGTSSLTLDGLTPGATYKLILFANGFGDPAGRFVTLSGSDGSFVFDANAEGDGNGVAVEYEYTAGATSETFTFDPHSAGDSYHHYAFANQFVASPLPEPAGIAVLAGAAALLGRRGRRR